MDRDVSRQRSNGGNLPPDSDQVGEVSNWSAGGSISATLSQSIEVSAEFKSPFGGGGAKSTSSWSVTGTAEFSKGGSETKTDTVMDEWPIIAPPNRMFKAQMILSEQDLQDVKWTATFLASGPTEVIFRPTQTQISGDFCLKTHNNRNYVTTERSDKRKVVANRTWCRIWEHFRFQDAGGRNLAAVNSGNHVFVQTYFGTYLSAQPNGKLEGNRGHRRPWEKFEIRRVGPGSGPIKANEIITLRSVAFNKWVVAEGAGGSIVNANRPKRSTWETFTIVPVSGEVPKAVAIELLLDPNERTITLTGTFTGTFTSYQSDIRAIDFDIKADCEEERRQLAGLQRAPAGTFRSQSTAPKAAKAVSALVTENKLSPQELTKVKLLPAKYRVKR